jgi:hypothetical protein
VAPRSDMHTAVRNLTPAETADDPRAIWHTRVEQFQKPSAALEILRSYVPSCPTRVEAVCTPQQYLCRENGGGGRFVVRVDVLAAGDER